MDVNDIRYRFENHMEDFYPTLSLMTKETPFIQASSVFINNEGKEYNEPGVQLMWLMYYSGAVAQYKNTSITLPPLKDKPQGYFDAGFNEGVHECRRHLISSGIKLKK